MKTESDMIRQSNYDKFPAMDVPGHAANVWQGDRAIFRCLTSHLSRTGSSRQILVVDTYPGVNDSDVLSALSSGLKPDRVINTLDVKKTEAQTLRMIEGNLTDDRIFGVLSPQRLEDFFDTDKLNDARTVAEGWSDGLLLVYGVGAASITQGDVLVYADLARWEIQRRYRRGMGNWGAENGDEDFFRKYKRGFFVEWRAADRHKFSIFDQFDFLLDTNQVGEPKLLAAEALHAGLNRAATQPFRVVPVFDPAPWGGQWMKETCDLDREVANYGWCFDCVPEENSLLLDVGGTRVEIPSLNLVYRHSVELLGQAVYARFGCEFPIRFDFLDTIDGGSLSFQVHPLNEYIQQHFGMPYTQDESYYILDARDNSTVYLGLKDDIDREAMVRDLQAAQQSMDCQFDVEKYVNRWPAKKHDHFLIPAGTVHCSGAGCMVLEISATPYIFTFKMWDWGRLGLDDRPRPIHLQHAVANIQWDRTTEPVREQMINRFQPVTEGEGWREERTGLHESEFIETRRHWFTRTTPHNTRGSVNVLNLIEGEEAVIESPDGAFNPYVVHFAETFIVPAAAGAYTIRPHGIAEGTECATIKAYVGT